MLDILGLIESWDGEGVVVRHDEATGTWMFIALHDTTLGPAVGGTRMKVYPSLSAALTDAMRLAEGMTHKWAGLGMDWGGGKAVLAVPKLLEGQTKEGLLQRYGWLVESLRGTFTTGPDMGMGPENMAVVAGQTTHVLGVTRDTAAEADPGVFTAHGVLAGIESAARQALGSAGLDGVSVLIEGVGDVGAPLARNLAGRGAQLILCDRDGDKVRRIADEIGASVVPTDGAATTECDVYAPCAVGATVTEQTIPGLRCKIVAGSANNQLGEAADALRLRERGILYAPDYVINSGGAMAFALMQDGLLDGDALIERVREIGPTLDAIFDEASHAGIDPLAAVQRRVDRLLAQRRLQRKRPS